MPLFLRLPILIFLLLGIGIAVDCVYFPANFSVISTIPVKPMSNCLEYCNSQYAQAPQRIYYNITSQNCEPIRMCKVRGNYYDYDTNKCYKDKSLSQQTESYIPATLKQETTQFGANKGTQMVCVNGQYQILYIGYPAVCYCDFLWKDSNKLDLNGFPFQCDEVTDYPESFFNGDCDWDPVNKQYTRYGPFSANQMKVLLLNLKSVQQRQVNEYAINQTDPILYAISINLPQQPLIRDSQYIYLLPIFLTVMVIFIISYWQFQKLTISITTSQLKKKIHRVITQQQLIRSVN